MSKHSKGFTLAEVLITIGVIGVVAALTIPTLMANNQKTQYVTALKKMYAEVNQSLVKVTEDYGCAGDFKCTGLFVNAGSHTLSNELLGQAFVKHFNVAKDYGFSADRCFPTSIAYNYDGTDVGCYRGGNAGSYNFLTTGGVLISLASNEDNCSGNLPDTTYMTVACGGVYFDLNGPKKPNVFGRDVFGFMISNGHGPMLYPLGGVEMDYWGYSWKDPVTGTPEGCAPVYMDGSYCAGRIIDEGWQMNY